MILHVAVHKLYSNEFLISSLFGQQFYFDKFYV